MDKTTFEKKKLRLIIFFTLFTCTQNEKNTIVTFFIRFQIEIVLNFVYKHN